MQVRGRPETGIVLLTAAARAVSFRTLDRPLPGRLCTRLVGLRAATCGQSLFPKAELARAYVSRSVQQVLAESGSPTMANLATPGC